MDAVTQPPGQAARAPSAARCRGVPPPRVAYHRRAHRARAARRLRRPAGEHARARGGRRARRPGGSGRPFGGAGAGRRGAPLRARRVAQAPERRRPHLRHQPEQLGHARGRALPWPSGARLRPPPRGRVQLLVCPAERRRHARACASTPRPSRAGLEAHRRGRRPGAARRHACGCAPARSPWCPRATARPSTQVALERAAVRASADWPPAVQRRRAAASGGPPQIDHGGRPVQRAAPARVYLAARRSRCAIAAARASPCRRTAWPACSPSTRGSATQDEPLTFDNAHARAVLHGLFAAYETAARGSDHRRQRPRAVSASARAVDGIGVDMDQLVLGDHDARRRRAGLRTVYVALRDVRPRLTHRRRADHGAGHAGLAVRHLLRPAQHGARGNIELGRASLVDGTVVPPGDVFSLNATLGPRTINRGFDYAPVIAAGNVLRQGVGGGICQYATTLFNAVFFAGLPVVERHNHSPVHRALSHRPRRHRRLGQRRLQVPQRHDAGAHHPQLDRQRRAHRGRGGQDGPHRHLHDDALLRHPHAGARPGPPSRHLRQRRRRGHHALGAGRGRAQREGHAYRESARDGAVHTTCSRPCYQPMDWIKRMGTEPARPAGARLRARRPQPVLAMTCLQTS